MSFPWPYNNPKPDERMSPWTFVIGAVLVVFLVWFFRPLRARAADDYPRPSCYASMWSCQTRGNPPQTECKAPQWFGCKTQKRGKAKQ